MFTQKAVARRSERRNNPNTNSPIPFRVKTRSEKCPPIKQKNGYERNFSRFSLFEQ